MGVLASGHMSRRKNLAYGTPAGGRVPNGSAQGAEREGAGHEKMRKSQPGTLGNPSGTLRNTRQGYLTKVENLTKSSKMRFLVKILINFVINLTQKFSPRILRFFEFCDTIRSDTIPYDTIGYRIGRRDHLLRVGE